MLSPSTLLFDNLTFPSKIVDPVLFASFAQSMKMTDAIEALFEPGLLDDVLLELLNLPDEFDNEDRFLADDYIGDPETTGKFIPIDEYLFRCCESLLQLIATYFSSCDLDQLILWLL
jgi:hypothetical protein